MRCGSNACWEVGTAGVLWFSIIFLFSFVILILSRATKFQPWAKIMPLTLVVCVLETPRYLLLIMHNRYSSPTAYASHMAGSIVFFTFLSLIWFAWVRMLGPFKPRYTMRLSKLLFLINLVFDGVSLLLIIALATRGDPRCRHLRPFFDAIAYETLTQIDILKNLSLACVMYVFTFSVLKTIQEHASRWAKAGCDTGTDLEILTRNLAKASQVAILMSTSRTTMLFFKIIMAQRHATTVGVKPVKLEKFSLVWWTFSDLLPRGGPLIAYAAAIAQRAYARRKRLAPKPPVNPRPSVRCGDLELYSSESSGSRFDSEISSIDPDQYVNRSTNRISRGGSPSGQISTTITINVLRTTLDSHTSDCLSVSRGEEEKKMSLPPDDLLAQEQQQQQASLV